MLSFFLHLIQDLDLLCPLIREAQRDPELTPAVYLTDRLYGESPRTVKALRSLGVQYRILSRFGLTRGEVPELSGTRALVTASESNARPHLPAYRLTQSCNRRGVRTYTLQHGLENIGLTYFDKQFTPSSVHIASQKILLWGHLSTLEAGVPDAVRLRCVEAGCTKDIVQEAPPSPKLPGTNSLVLVCENLHWERYTPGYRRGFLKSLKECAQKYGEATFLVKPHHDQRWFARQGRSMLSDLKNVVVADPGDPQWEPYTTAGLLPLCDAVITTPSTAALDAARAGLPTAVVSDDSDASVYSPLVEVRRTEEWIFFLGLLREPKFRADAVRRSRELVARVLAPGDGVRRALDFIKTGVPAKHALTTQGI